MVPQSFVRVFLKIDVSQSYDAEPLSSGQQRDDSINVNFVTIGAWNFRPNLLLTIRRQYRNCSGFSLREIKVARTIKYYTFSVMLGL